MASKTRKPAVAVKDALLANGEKYGYFQAVRLLRLFDRKAGLPVSALRVRPKLGLEFPETDIDRIDVRPEGGHRITANFFGLYGVSSPLPTYYTEDLFEEQREGRHSTREFLDIVHYALYPLLFDAWAKYRLEQRVIEDADTTVLGHLHAFIGLGDAELRSALQPGSAHLLRYAGLLNQRPRSASGLATMLADAFPQARVKIDACVPHEVDIPGDQRWRLSARHERGEGGAQTGRLGEDIHLGSRIDDYMSHVRICLTALPHAQFEQLIPGMAGHEQLRFLTRFYLTDPLSVDIELELAPGDVQPARMGTTSWSRLGWDTWLSPEPCRPPARMRFSL
jgi:type VI secretion system protein ImpH